MQEYDNDAIWVSYMIRMRGICVRLSWLLSPSLSISGLRQLGRPVSGSRVVNDQMAFRTEALVQAAHRVVRSRRKCSVDVRELGSVNNVVRKLQGIRTRASLCLIPSWPRRKTMTDWNLFPAVTLNTLFFMIGAEPIDLNRTTTELSAS